MTTPSHANRDLMRAINRSTVLNTIKNHGPLSRTEIAKRTRLSAATVSAITAELIQSNLVFEKEAGDSSGGRRPILLALNPRGGFVIGMKLAEDHVTGALTDLEASIVAKTTLPLPAGTVDTAIDTMAAAVDALHSSAGNLREKLLGVGVGLAGIIDHRQGELRYSPIFGWRSIPLAALLEARLQVDVRIDNDVNTLTFTELWFGRGKGVENFLTITVGRGIGLGIVVNGQVYQGLQGGVGEFGHTSFDPEGPLCACGKRGCLETYAADPGLLRMANEAQARGELLAGSLTVEELCCLAESGHPTARAIYTQAGAALGLGIANLINVLNPQLIILSGEGVRAGEVLFAPMRAMMQAQVMPGLSADTRFQIDDWDDSAWARGAAGMILRDLFESPIHHEPARLASLF